MISSDSHSQFWMEELLVCTWHHGSHVGGQEQKHFSPLENKLYYHVNSLRKNSIVLTPNTATLSCGYKPRIINKIGFQLLESYFVSCIHVEAILEGYLVQVGEITPYPKKCNSIKQTKEKCKQSCNLNQKIPMKSLLPHPSHLLGCLHPPVFWNFWIGYIACLITWLSIASSLITV